MKVFSVLLLACFYTSALAEHSVEELIAHGELCGGTVDDLAKLALYQAPETHTGKCMSSCMVKHVGIVNKEGKFNKSKLKKFFKYKWTEFKDIGDEIADNCDVKLSSYQGNDECDYGHEVVECFAGHMREKNYFNSLLEKSNKLREKLISGTYKTTDEIKEKVNRDLENYKQYL